MAGSFVAVQKSKSNGRRAKVAVIVPVYNSLATLQELIDRLCASLASITKNFEVILVDDRGPQAVWPVIEAAGQKDARVKGLRLSRNFGQHAAISAGLETANADWYVVMDCDLQDLPEDIPKLYQHAVDNKLDSVLAFRASHDVGRRRRFGSLVFNKTLEHLADIPASSQVGNFRIFNNAMAVSYRMYPEKMRLFPALMSHIGFEVGQFDVSRPDRIEGESNYTISKLFQLGFDSIVSNTIKPMYYLAGFGIFISVIAVLLALVVVVRALVFGAPTEGWASLMTVVMLMGGIQIFVISFVGIYVGKVFFEVKDRPVYIVSSTSNIKGS